MFCQDFLSCIFLDKLRLRKFRLSGFRNLVLVVKVMLFTFSVTLFFYFVNQFLSKLCRLIVRNITEVMCTQQIGIKVHYLTDHLRKKRGFSFRVRVQTSLNQIALSGTEFTCFNLISSCTVFPPLLCPYLYQWNFRNLEINIPHFNLFMYMFFFFLFLLQCFAISSFGSLGSKQYF